MLEQETGNSGKIHQDSEHQVRRGPTDFLVN